MLSPTNVSRRLMVTVNDPRPPPFCWEFGKNTTSEPVCYKSLFSSYLQVSQGAEGTAGLTTPSTVPPQTLGSFHQCAPLPHSPRSLQ